jgi:hypothetical protein
MTMADWWECEYDKYLDKTKAAKEVLRLVKVADELEEKISKLERVINQMEKDPDIINYKTLEKKKKNEYIENMKLQALKLEKEFGKGIINWNNLVNFIHELEETNE